MFIVYTADPAQIDPEACPQGYKCVADQWTLGAAGVMACIRTLVTQVTGASGRRSRMLGLRDGMFTGREMLVTVVRSDWSWSLSLSNGLWLHWSFEVDCVGVRGLSNHALGPGAYI
jgi:hypothetical protein